MTTETFTCTCGAQATVTDTEARLERFALHWDMGHEDCEPTIADLNERVLARWREARGRREE